MVYRFENDRPFFYVIMSAFSGHLGFYRPHKTYVFQA